MRIGVLRLEGWLVRALIAWGVIVATIATSVAAQTADSTRPPAIRIIGVFDARTGGPLQGVQVRDAFSGNYVMTSATGTARLDFLTFRGAAAFVELRRLGYEAKQVIVSRADTASITELLEPAVTLAPVVTTEKYRIDRDVGRWEGFEQRCQSRSVTCIRTEDLERRPAANLADFLIRAEGVTLGACGGGSGHGGAGRNAQCGKIAMKPVVIPPAYCEPTFFVDGFEWNSHMGSPADMAPNTPPQAPYTPSNVKAVEVYPPERPRPARFQGDPTCGVVVVWTK
jgi:hypothetical protein